MQFSTTNKFPRSRTLLSANWTTDAAPNWNYPTPAMKLLDIQADDDESKGILLCEDSDEFNDS